MGLYLFGGGGSFERVFLDQSGLPFGHLSGYLSFLHAFIHFGWQSIVYVGEFLKPKSMYANWVRGFLVWCFLVLTWVRRGVFPPCDLLRVFATLLSCYLFIRLFFCFLRTHILLQDLFASYLAAGMSLPILLLPIGRIFIRCFRKSCFVCIFGPVSVSF